MRNLSGGSVLWRAKASFAAGAGLLLLTGALASGQGQPGQQPVTASEPQPEASRLAAEEALARSQALLERRPFHRRALDELIKQNAEFGAFEDLVVQYQARVEALEADDGTARIILARLLLRSGQAAEARDTLAQLPADSEVVASRPIDYLVLRSELEERLGNLQEAQALLGQALDLAETTSERLDLTESIADLRLRSGDREGAAAVFVELAEQFPGDYLHRKRIADALAKRGLHDAASQQYQAILPLVERQTDRRCEVLRQLGQSYEALEQPDRAIAVYTEALGLLASGHWMERELHERIVGLYRASDRLDDLVAYCRNQIAASPAQTAMRMLLAEVLEASGDAVGARQALREASELFPDDIEVGRRYIKLLETHEEFASAAGEYERLIARQRNDLQLYIDYGEFLARHDQLEGARNQWNQVLESELSDAGLALRLARLFETYELAEDARRCYERAIELDPARAESYQGLARRWLAAGDREQAIETLARMAEANPDDAGLHAERAHELHAIGELDLAIEAAQRAAELEPHSAKHQVALADLLVRAGQLDDALSLRRDAIGLARADGERARAIETLVSMYATAGGLEDLEQTERQRLAASPEDLDSHLILARVADYQRNFPAARAMLEAALRIDPAHEQARQQLARLLEAVGDLDGAIATYRDLIERAPARGRMYYQAIVDVSLRHGDRAGAVQTLERMVQADPRNATVLSSVAEQFIRLEQIERGLELFEQALALQPGDHAARLEYARALQEAGRLRESLDSFMAAALQASDRDTASRALSMLHEVAGQLGAIEEVIDDLLEKVERNPDQTLAASAAADLLIREFEYGRAVELLDHVLRMSPRNADLHLARAALLRQLARADEALEAYSQALRLPQADRDYVLGEMGKASFEAGRVADAERYWRQVSHKLYAGTLLRNNGLLDEAVEVLREGIRLKPDDYSLHRNLVQALQSAGRDGEALEAARGLLDLEPDNLRNIESVARAYLDRGDRVSAAKVASRMFGAAVTVPQTQASSGSGYGRQYAYGGYGAAGGGRTNFDRASEFFLEAGLTAELTAALNEQLARQPDNAVLWQSAAELFADSLNEPQRAMEIYAAMETMAFPLEYQTWLGRSSQRDAMRAQRYELVASKTALRDARLSALAEAEAAGSLDRDGRIELALIRWSQGLTDQAVALLRRAVEQDASDVMALSALADILTRSERFAEAEAPARRLVAVLDERRDAVQSDMVERVRREFVRTLPVPMQLRIDEKLLRQIADRWMLGEGFQANWGQTPGVMSLMRARLTLATICAKTDRMDEARAIWTDLAPRQRPDPDGFITLASVAQLHDQSDIAFSFYEQALVAAKELAGDPLLERVFGDSLTQQWFSSSDGATDTSFNKIVSAFAAHERLIDLYDFLRATGRTGQARRIARQYELHDDLKTLYAQRVDAARLQFHAGNDPLVDSVAYFADVAKLAELHDQTGDWDEAQRVYESYLEDFADELELLRLLGQIAEAQNDIARAIEWEQAVVACQQRLARKGRQWSMRQLTLLPSIPSSLERTIDEWSWQGRWGGSQSYGWYYGRTDPLDTSQGLMRIARFYLALENPIAAGDAMQRAVAAAGQRQRQVIGEALSLIRERRLVGELLPVLRSLAVRAPMSESVQLAFGESLEQNDRTDVAAEVYRRVIRRGVSSVGVLGQVRTRLAAIEPDSQEAAKETLETLEATVAASPSNANEGLRLAKAYFYSLRVDEALEAAARVQELAPHLDGVHDLLVEIHTLRDDTEALLAALEEKIKRTTDPAQKRSAQQRLASELMQLGRTDDAIEQVKLLANPSDPGSYTRIGLILQYFGRHDEAIEQFELASSSQRGGYGRQGAGDADIARALLLRGDLPGAADRILKAVDESQKQARQYGGMYAAYAMYGDEDNPFQPFMPPLVLEPQLQAELGARLEARHEQAPADPGAAKLLMHFYRATGRPDRAEQMLSDMAGAGQTDQQMVSLLIDRAIAKREYETAITLAEDFIAQQPKPKLPAGVPADYAGHLVLGSARNAMLCTLGDIHHQRGDTEKAFEAYARIVDEDIDASRIAYASICLFRGRTDEARQIVDEALDAQQVKSKQLLEFRAIIAAIDADDQLLFQLLTQAAEAGEDQADRFSYGRSNVLATAARVTGQVDEYLRLMNERIQRAPDDWSLYQEMISVLDAVGRGAESLALIDQAATRSALELSALQAKVQKLDPGAGAETLIPLYRRIVELTERQAGQGDSRRGMYAFYEGYSAEAPGTERLSQLLWDTGDREGALELWTRRLDEKSAGALHGVATKLLERGEAAGAADYLQRALEVDPVHAAAHRKLAAIAFADGNLEQTFEHLLASYLRDQEGTEGEQYWWWYRSGETIDDRRKWAAELRLREDELLAGLDEAEAEEARLMLAVLAGDWEDATELTRARIERLRYDPLTWRLYAECLQQSGQWEQAAEAMGFLERIEQTSIGRHREQLELALAGRQVREAAGGVRSASPGAASAAAGNPYASGRSYSSYSRSFSYGYSDDDGLRRRAAIHVHLGEYDKAIQLYITSEMSAEALSSVAGLLWRQGVRDRALELMRLWTLFSSDTSSSVLLYAGMLSEAGGRDEAVKLLINAYRCAQAPSDRSGYLSAMYGYAYGMYAQNTGIESSEESSIATALYGMLTRAGTLDETLASLHDRIRAAPDDQRLIKLRLGLEMRDGRWADARKSLEGWREISDDDPAVLRALLGALVQTRDWKAAEIVIDESIEVSPQQTESLQLARALVRLASGDPETAGAALADQAPQLMQKNAPTWTVAAVMMAAAGELDALCEVLLARHRSGNLEPQGERMLQIALATAGRGAELAHLAARQVWRDPQPLDSASPGVTALLHAGRLCRATGEHPQFEREADRALYLLASQGPAASLEAFQALRHAMPDDIDVLRGVILAADLAGEIETQAEASRALIDYLGARRFEVWREPRRRSLTDLAGQTLDQYRASGLDSQSILGLSTGFGSLIQQMFTGGSQYGYNPYYASASVDDGQSAIMHDALWRAHCLTHKDVLSRLGDAARYSAWLEHLHRLNVQEEDSYSYAYRRRMETADRAPESETDRQQRNWLFTAGKLEAYVAAAEARGDALPLAEWPQLAEACAATGRAEDALRWRRRAARAHLAHLRGSDQPRLDSGGTRSYWRWGSDEDRRVQWIAYRLAQVKLTDDEAGARPRPASSQQPVERWRTLAWQAAQDPQIAASLLAAEPSVSIGWGQTDTLRALVAYYGLQEEHDRAVELIDRALETPALLDSEMLTPYIQACLKAGRHERVEELLELAGARSVTLAEDVDLLRLGMLRLAGDAEAADSIEQQLLDACKWPREVPIPLDPEFNRQLRATAPDSGAARSSRHERRATFQAGVSLEALAEALGVPCKPDIQEGDLTCGQLRSVYQRLDLHADALRMCEIELARATTEERRLTLLQEKGRLLGTLGRHDEARAACLSALDDRLAAFHRGRGAPQEVAAAAWMLAADSLGAAPETALERLAAASASDPLLETVAEQRAVLFAAGRYQEAWAAYQRGMRTGEMDYTDTAELYRAGISATRAGADGSMLLRQALWRAPDHELAADAKGILQ